jgi:hypothetical protein
VGDDQNGICDHTCDAGHMGYYRMGRMMDPVGFTRFVPELPG